MSSGTPYIGSKISLVSKAEIRYEGFLYTIDQNDSTVTLAKVISLGTEDRVPDSPVPAREEVFEYIVFRGSDIKDLHVCEGPKRVEDPAIVHQSSHSYSQNYNHPSNYHHHRSPFNHGHGGHGGHSGHGGGIPNFGYNPFNFHPNGPGGDVSGSRQHTPPNLPRADSRGGQTKNQVGGFQDNNRGKLRNNDGRYKDENDRYSKDNRDNSNRSTKENRNEQYDDSRDRGNKDREVKNKDRMMGRGSRSDRENNEDRKGQRSNSQENADKYDNRERKDTGDRDRRVNNRDRDSKDSRYIKDNRNYRDNRYRQNKKDNQEDDHQRVSSDASRGHSRGRGSRGFTGRGGGRGRGAPRGGGSNRTKFTEDFDFETANAKFNKEEIEKELLKVLKKVKIKDEDGEGTELKDEMDERESDERAPLPSPDKFYDRSKSFFDNILCEAMVPKTEDEVMTRRQEQALNAETFGNSASHFRPGYRGRGRGRGRWRGQGRGGFYRGRGNYRGNNSNRRWVDYEFDYEAAGIKNRHQPMKVSSGGNE